VFTSKVAVVIPRPLDEVFAFVADARNRPLEVLEGGPFPPRPFVS